MRGLRRVTGDEIRRDTGDVLIDLVDMAQKTVPYTEFYSKFRACVFINVGLFVVLGIMMSLKCLLSGESDSFPLAGFSLIFAVIMIFFCKKLWEGVAQKVPENERKLVFWGFFSTGVLTFGKILLYCTIILIPLIGYIGGEYKYTYRKIEEGEHAGEVVLMRYKLNGQLVDIYGNIYEE